MTKIIALLSWFYIRTIKYYRNILPAEKYICQKKKFCLRDFVPHERISCHRKKFPVTGRHFLLQDEIFYHRKKFLVTGQNFMSQYEISNGVSLFVLGMWLHSLSFKPLFQRHYILGLTPSPSMCLCNTWKKSTILLTSLI